MPPSVAARLCARLSRSWASPEMKLGVSCGSWGEGPGGATSQWGLGNTLRGKVQVRKSQLEPLWLPKVTQ